MILNYTTKVAESKTVSEIQQTLGRKGADQVLVEYVNGEPSAVMFRYTVNGQSIPFKLPCKFEGVKNAMLKQFKDKWTREQKAKNPIFCEQVRRVAWRIVKDWIEAQMALIEAGQAEIAEVFLPYVMVGPNQTMFQRFTENTSRMLGDGQ